jgi:hypothetical protein
LADILPPHRGRRQAAGTGRPGAAVTTESKEPILAERVRALTTLILTRRGDLTVLETKKDTGLDLHVHVEREDKPMRLTFGVLLRGVASPLSADQAKGFLQPQLRAAPAGHEWQSTEAVGEELLPPVLKADTSAAVRTRRGGGSSCVAGSLLIP